MRIISITITGILLFLLVACEANPVSSPSEAKEQSLTGDFKVLWGEKMGVPANKFLIGPAESLDRVSFKVMPFADLSGEVVDSNTKSIKEMIIDQEEADLIVFDSRMLPALVESGYLEPLEDRLESNAIDLNGFRSDLINLIKSAAPSGQLYALPYAQNVYGLFYNKDIFDSLSLPYPANGMTWTDLNALASQFEKSGYNGLDISSYASVATQFNIRLYD